MTCPCTCADSGQRAVATSDCGRQKLGNCFWNVCSIFVSRTNMPWHWNWCQKQRRTPDNVGKSSLWGQKPWQVGLLQMVDDWTPTSQKLLVATYAKSKFPVFYLDLMSPACLPACLPAWLTDWLTDWLNDSEWMNDWLTEWLTDWLPACLPAC